MNMIAVKRRRMVGTYGAIEADVMVSAENCGHVSFAVIGERLFEALGTTRMSRTWTKAILEAKR